MSNVRLTLTQNFTYTGCRRKQSQMCSFISRPVDVYSEPNFAGIYGIWPASCVPSFVKFACCDRPAEIEVNKTRRRFFPDRKVLMVKRLWLQKYSSILWLAKFPPYPNNSCLQCCMQCNNAMFGSKMVCLHGSTLWSSTPSLWHLYSLRASIFLSRKKSTGLFQILWRNLVKRPQARINFL